MTDEIFGIRTLIVATNTETRSSEIHSVLKLPGRERLDTVAGKERMKMRARYALKVRACLLERICAFGSYKAFRRDTPNVRYPPKADLLDYDPRTTIVGCDLGLQFLYYQVDPD